MRVNTTPKTKLKNYLTDMDIPSDKNLSTKVLEQLSKHNIEIETTVSPIIVGEMTKNENLYPWPRSVIRDIHPWLRSVIEMYSHATLRF